MHDRTPPQKETKNGPHSEIHRDVGGWNFGRLPADVAEALHRVKGRTYLWEKYIVDSRTYRPGKRNADKFTPNLWYFAVKAIFKRFAKAHPEAKVKSHDLRKRLVTLLVKNGATVEQVAQASGMTVQNAQRSYLDLRKAIDGPELLKRHADLLRPQI